MFGMVSDMLTVIGLRRTPYIILAASIGILSQLLLSGIMPLTLIGVCLLMVGSNYSIACPDVMIDASIAIKVQLNKEFSSDLQSLCWGSYAVCSVLGYSTAGVLIYFIGAPSTVGLLTIVSSIVFMTGSLGFLGEQPIDSKESQLISLDFTIFNSNRRLFILAICVSLIAVILTVTTISTDDFITQVLVIIFCATSVTCLCYFTNIKQSPDIAKFSIFIFLIESFTPNLETAMFYWLVFISILLHFFFCQLTHFLFRYTDADNGPNFSSFYMGFLNTLGYLLMLCGVLIFNKYLCYYPYKSTFMLTQVSISLFIYLFIYSLTTNY